MNLLEVQQLLVEAPPEQFAYLILVVLTLTLTVSIIALWKKVRRLFSSTKHRAAHEAPNLNTERVTEAARNKTSSRALSPIAEIEMDQQLQSLSPQSSMVLNGQTVGSCTDKLDEISEVVENCPQKALSHPPPDWIDGPRDVSVLPIIVQSTFCPYVEEAEYALKQMLLIIEDITNVDEHIDSFVLCLNAIQCRLPSVEMDEQGNPAWDKVYAKLVEKSESPFECLINKTENGLTLPQISSIIDTLPFLFDNIALHKELHHLGTILSFVFLMILRIVAANSKNVEVALVAVVVPIAIPLLEYGPF
ncbi:unnamed protein product [Caenorhabditis bovis]|uniref:Uncharacterized protein n=1 Tax=Caenorhabditis bovis TaxID=2654633 RepID=A0A8S1F6X4_9PELO|nr:unnamed protein product [Caenorhabditis bovis]